MQLIEDSQWPSRFWRALAGACSLSLETLKSRYFKSMFDYKSEDLLLFN